MPNYTPMMAQYFAIKSQYAHCLLMFRLGDFYEMFFDDALAASKALDITLTGRDCGQAERAPMCGVPYHAADGYIARLVEKGFHVAICEQVEDPKQAKGIVKREVIRVVTPGTVLDTRMLDEGRNNFITCLYQDKKGIGCATADITTGLFMVTALPADEPQKLYDELARLNPAEMIAPEGFPLKAAAEAAAGGVITPVPAWTCYPGNAFKCLTAHFKTLHLEGYGLKENTPEVCAAGALLQYLTETQKNALHQITAMRNDTRQQHMNLDGPSRRNLELTAAMHGRGKKDSLLGTLDYTETPMGARLLRSWVEQPLIEAAEINRRLEAVAELKENALLRAELQELLHTVHDLERLMTKLAANTANGRDVSALRASFKNLPHIGSLIADCQSEVNGDLYRTFDDLADLYRRIDDILVDEPPFSVREGGMIKGGYDAELDKLLTVKENGSVWLAELEAREREQTGVKNLKVRYNKVFGYYIEITKSNVHLAPQRYVRRQTLANGERFTTEELKTLEDTILGADEKRTELEYTLFDTLRREMVEQMARIQFTAYALATLDALTSLAEAAERHRYVKPTVNNSGRIYIKEGRHPVVEARTPHAFVPNDTELDTEEGRLSIITGPNMAGKSTYMRQVALIVLMAQIGSFVPADEAAIGVVDRIFTRVGASDDLATGQSTFMVEMTEVANILHNASRHSLILLDEIGRGTSTFDGLSIAWAVLEYIADTAKIGAKTLFATHYHELTELEGRVPGVVNYCFTVQEQGEDVVFLRKLARGGADHSFGIHVARLAGLPPTVLTRAREVLKALNEADITRHTDGGEGGEAATEATTVAAAHTVIDAATVATAHTAADATTIVTAHGATEDTTDTAATRIGTRLTAAVAALDIDRITPLEAIMVLDRLKAMLIEA